MVGYHVQLDVYSHTIDWAHRVRLPPGANPHSMVANSRFSLIPGRGLRGCRRRARACPMGRRGFCEHCRDRARLEVGCLCKCSNAPGHNQVNDDVATSAQTFDGLQHNTCARVDRAHQVRLNPRSRNSIETPRGSFSVCCTHRGAGCITHQRCMVGERDHWPDERKGS